MKLNCIKKKKLGGQPLALFSSQEYILPLQIQIFLYVLFQHSSHLTGETLTLSVSKRELRRLGMSVVCCRVRTPVYRHVRTGPNLETRRHVTWSTRMCESKQSQRCHLGISLAALRVQLCEIWTLHCVSRADTKDLCLLDSSSHDTVWEKDHAAERCWPEQPDFIGLCVSWEVPCCIFQNSHLE